MSNSSMIRTAFLAALMTVAVFGGYGKARGSDTTGSVPADIGARDIPPLGGMGGHGTGGMIGGLYGRDHRPR